jgi:hypothetical protein
VAALLGEIVVEHGDELVAAGTVSPEQEAGTREGNLVTHVVEAPLALLGEVLRNAGRASEELRGLVHDVVVATLASRFLLALLALGLGGVVATGQFHTSEETCRDRRW